MIFKLALVLLALTHTISGFPGSSQVYPGQPISILEFKSTRTTKDFVFNSQALENILQHQDVIHRKISVISIMGAFRKGKSFLLDYFLRYMYTNYKSVGSPLTPVRKGKYPEWIGGSDEPLAGFSWRSGANRHTTGIIIWSDIFLYDAPNGDKIAILLMDTQGLFDHKSSPTDNSRIFSLSTLISSMQIFNLFSHIQEDHLQYLQFATEYARFATTNEDDQHTKAFQNLMFLIRDWNFPEDHAYGLQGGQELLNKVMQIEEDQLPELKSLRQYIFGSFDKISCVLMPHPGITVATKKNYDGRWSQIDKAFVDNLKDLAEALLSPRNLSIKKINNQDLQVNEFYIYLEQYIKMYKSQDLPEPQSIYEATVTNHMQILLAKSLSIYIQFVQNGYNNLTEIHDIDLLHNQAKELSTQRYLKEKKMGTADHDVTYGQLLENQINETLKKWKPTAIDHIKKLQEIKKKIEEEALLKREAQAKADKAKKELDKTTVDLQKANLEVDRVKHESDEVRAAAKQIQMEAQKIHMESKIREEAALRRAEEAKQRELEYKKDKDMFREQTRLQQEQLRAQMESLQSAISQAGNNGGGGGESDQDKVFKWISLATNVIPAIGGLFG